MTAIYKSICFEIDNLSLDIHKLMEKHIQCKLEMEKIMNEGYLNIAKTRYVMGSQCVSNLQLPTQDSNPIKPMSTVQKEKQNKHYVYELKREVTSPVQSNEESKSSEEDSNLGLRKRKDVKNIKEGSLEKAPISDPIKMFGVLVPGCLRLAQQSFVNSLKCISVIATIQSEIDAQLKRYQHLLEAKSLIEVTSTDNEVCIHDCYQYYQAKKTTEVLG